MAKMGTNIDPICTYLIKLAELDAKYKMGALGVIKDPTAMPKVIAAGSEFNAADSRGALAIRLAVQKNPYSEWIQALNTSGSGARMAQSTESKEELFLTNKNIKLYPNPSSGVVYYDYSFDDELKTEATIMVYNMLGEQVIGGKLAGNIGNGTIDFTLLPNGMYFVNIIRNNQQILNAKINVVK